jgi:hypothetical protein
MPNILLLTCLRNCFQCARLLHMELVYSTFQGAYTNFKCRSREFLWQEGHTAFATKEEADTEVFHQIVKVFCLSLFICIICIIIFMFYDCN